ncbi:carboxymuconolactone decarboxylase family protein [Gordonia sp. SL306]|uniref:carboxymuconolactone decarboxylase family protein n=1 Tax=Gordonia sp. SL306 TaxID=2995145 RepID=UPI002270D127|nr:carboxymuconolactone decarboxylase family protein [Gordonia sp. SL306]WAC54181.1 carboxymuconolactone decarboxylase family protein [Gordonia sp. SL306]
MSQSSAGYITARNTNARAHETPFEQAKQGWLHDQVWSRPGLGRRERRWVTLTCVGAADAHKPIDDQVQDALASGDISIDEMLEFVLHFAVYNGWPKASHLEGVIRRTWATIDRASGGTGTVAPPDNASLGLNDWDSRIADGTREFVEVNLIDAPRPETPYIHAGILNFVFGHVWQRPALTRRDRRFITVASVAVCDSLTPLHSHTGSALESGDITKPEMDEVVLQLAAYSGFAKAEALHGASEEAWARLQP